MSHYRQNHHLTSFFHCAISTTFAQNQSSRVYRLLQGYVLPPLAHTPHAGRYSHFLAEKQNVQSHLDSDQLCYTNGREPAFYGQLWVGHQRYLRYWHIVRPDVMLPSHHHRQAKSGWDCEWAWEHTLPSGV